MFGGARFASGGAPSPIAGIDAFASGGPLDLGWTRRRLRSCARLPQWSRLLLTRKGEEPKRTVTEDSRTPAPTTMPPGPDGPSASEGRIAHAHTAADRVRRLVLRVACRVPLNSTACCEPSGSKSAQRTPTQESSSAVAHPQRRPPSAEDRSPRLHDRAFESRRARSCKRQRA